MDKSKLDPESRRQLEIMELQQNVKDLFKLCNELKENDETLRLAIKAETENRKKSDYAVLAEIGKKVEVKEEKEGLMASILNIFK